MGGFKESPRRVLPYSNRNDSYRGGGLRSLRLAELWHTDSAACTLSEAPKWPSHKGCGLWNFSLGHVPPGGSPEDENGARGEEAGLVGEGSSADSLPEEM